MRLEGVISGTEKLNWRNSDVTDRRGPDVHEVRETQRVSADKPIHKMQ